MRKFLSDKALRHAVERLRDARLEEQPPLEECDHNFSPRFERAMDQLEQREQKHIILRKAAVFAASLLLVLLAGAAVVLAANPKARAAVALWLRELRKDGIYYFFPEVDPEAEFPTYRVGWMPDGFVLDMEVIEERYYGVVYIQEAGDEAIIFYYLPLDQVDILGIHGNLDTAERISIHGIQGEYVPYSDAYGADLVWIDADNQLLFSVSANLDKTTIIRIAEGITLAK